ncbi:MAG TPA: phenylalanine--tRNA ligase subunit beta [Verrucomicrobiae bacterium]|nr:phenylalanine--tRNA ligase subunit beta [Verrucomicrobiae bacterium]
MKFTYNWLKQYVDCREHQRPLGEFDWPPQELAEKLTFAGIEVEDIVSFGGGALEQVVVCQILSSEKHPNADKLSVCRVTDGKSERQIVCGAKNYKVGDKVPLALPGVTLPNGLTIKEAKLRGVESQGMLCSAAELKLAEDAEGLLILPSDTQVGIKLSEALGGADTVFDIEVTPNRPDWLSVIGIAREISALTGNPLKLPGISLAEAAESTEKLTSVKVEAPDLCPRYSARVIRGVKIGPSPAWLKQALEKVGMRSINNVVDVTNYVLFECGHPLHAFDYNLLAEHRIGVRCAERGERFVAIDDSKHELSSDMLVVADARRAVALAGIMGGKDSEINDRTTDVLLESAWFLPANVRKTSKKLGLSSESSYRFERGADIGGVIWASNRAAQLIQQVAGGDIARGVVDALAKPIQKRRVKCRYAQVNRLLGIAVPTDTVKKIFAGLGLSVIGSPGGSPSQDFVEVEIPTFRVDLEREVDLIEEVCRIHGVEKIPARMQPATVAVSEFDAQWDAIARVRQTLTALGFHEAMNQTMVAEGALKLQNPLSADMTALRAALVPGLLANLRTNVSRHKFDVKLFEIGRVFAADGRESLHLALAATGRRTTGDWERTEKVDFFDVKGALEELGVTAEVRQVPPTQAKRLDLRDAVFVAELELEPLLAAERAEKQFRELPKFPAVVRDVALVVDEAVTHAEVEAAIGGARNKFLERVELFDIFRGGTIPTGRKSLAYSLTFRAADRTLTDTEVNEAHDRIKRQLQETLKSEIREG